MTSLTNPKEYYLFELENLNSFHVNGEQYSENYFSYDDDALLDSEWNMFIHNFLKTIKSLCNSDCFLSILKLKDNSEIFKIDIPEYKHLFFIRDNNWDISIYRKCKLPEGVL